MTGRVSGVFSRQTSAEPGSDGADLKIRGFGSALVVVDGIPGRNYSDIDPSEIESVSVLKDASAAAVYGMQGANGVILVTTKRGGKNKPTTLDINTRFGLQMFHNYPQPASTPLLQTLVGEYYANMKLINDKNAVITPADMATRDYAYNTNWYEEMIKNAPITQSNINISGGTDKVSYFISAGYLYQGGIWSTNSTDKNRFNFRSNLDADILKNLKLSVGVGAVINSLNYPRSASYEIARKMKDMAPNIPVEAINKMMQQLITDNNQVVLLAGPEKEGVKYPTKDEITALLKQMKSFDLKPYEDKVSNEPLISEDIKGGKIVSEKADDVYGSTKLGLSNGVTVYVKPTHLKADEIMMKGVSLGGTSVFPNDEIIDIAQLNGVALVGGIGNFSKVDLSKALAGKRASVGAGIGNTTETISGSCSPKDFETMMQLTYLTFTSPRKDNEAFESYKNRLKAELQNADANPMSAFSDTITSALYNNHPRAIKMKENMVDKINYDRIIDMYKDRYKDASDFTFYLVGNVDLEKVKPMIAKYLGSLPTINRKETFKDNKMYIRKGKYKNEFAKKQETPMATIMFFYSGTCKYDLRNNILLSFLDQALDMVYTAEIREKEGGTYGVSCNGSLGKYPKEELILQIIFQTDPAKKDKLSAVVVEQLNKMAKEGPSAEHMQKIKEYMLKKYKDAQKENGYWLNNLDEYFYTGIDNTKDYEKIVNSITAKEVQDFLARLLKQNNEIQVVMTMPEEAK